MRTLQVGSNSIHFTSYLQSLESNQDDLLVISEDAIPNLLNYEAKIFEFRTTNPLKLLQNTRELKKLLQQWKPTLVHIHQINRLGFFVARAAWKLKIPVVTTAWGGDVLLMPKKNFLFKYIVQKTIERSKVVTADSEEMIRVMEKLSLKTRYVHVQYGIDPIASGEKEMIIFTNRLHKPNYRILAIIEYFNEFSKANDGWKLAIGATGKETESLILRVKELNLEDKVVFLGWLDSETNNAWYAKSTMFISIPESDGTAVSLLEAMSAGCIPIVSDLQVSKEWIQDGYNGVIEKTGYNPLIEALNIDQQKAANYNRTIIEERATRKSSQLIFQKIYSDVIKN